MSATVIPVTGSSDVLADSDYMPAGLSLGKPGFANSATDSKNIGSTKQPSSTDGPKKNSKKPFFLLLLLMLLGTIFWNYAFRSGNNFFDAQFKNQQEQINKLSDKNLDSEVEGLADFLETNNGFTGHEDRLQVLESDLATLQLASAGDQGPQGPTGPKGNPGSTGPTGPQGPTGDAFFSRSGSDAYFSGGNFGLGTSNPQATLHVDGTLRFASLVNCDTIDTDASGTLACGSDDSGAAGTVTGSGTNGQVSYFNGSSTLTSSANLLFDGNDLNVASGTLFVDQSAGRVGVGTATPGASYKLDVNGTLNTTLLNVASPNGGLQIENTSFDNFTISNKNSTFPGTNLRLSTRDSVSIFPAGSSSSYGNPSILFKPFEVLFKTADTIRFDQTYGATGAGNIITEVSDGAGAVGLTLNNTTTLTTPGAKLLSVKNNGSEVANINYLGGAYFGGNVGVGTATPNSRLSFGMNLEDKIRLIDNGPTNSYGFGISSATLQIYAGSASGNIAFLSNGYSGTEMARFDINGLMLSSTHNSIHRHSYNGSIDVNNALFVYGTGSPSYAGNVGIGTTTPGHKLDVAGNGRFGDGIANGDLYLRSPTSGQNITLQTRSTYNALLSPETFILSVSGAGNDYILQTNGINRFRVSEAGNVGIKNDIPGNLLSINTPTTADTSATALITPNTVSSEGLVIQALASQTGDLLQAQDSTGTVLASIDASGNLSVKAATITGVLTVNGHIVSGNTSGTTTIANGANIGVGGSTSISGNDTAGTVTINTGTAATSGLLATISFANAYGVAPRVTLTPSNGNAASIQYFKTSTTTTIEIRSNNTPASSSTFIYDYQVIQ